MASILQTPAVKILPAAVSLQGMVYRRMRRDPWMLLCTTILGIILLASLLAHWIAPYPYEQIDLKLGASSPSPAHWMGTDTLGRDLFSRCLYGGQILIAVGVVGTLVSLLI